MKLISLFRVICDAAPHWSRRSAVRDVRLWHDAEFQVMLRELRYPPIGARAIRAQQRNGERHSPWPHHG